MKAGAKWVGSSIRSGVWSRAGISACQNARSAVVEIPFPLLAPPCLVLARQERCFLVYCSRGFSGVTVFSAVDAEPDYRRHDFRVFFCGQS